MDKLKLGYMDDIMSKANYALMEGEINYDEWLYIIQTFMQIVAQKCKKQKGNKNV